MSSPARTPVDHGKIVGALPEKSQEMDVIEAIKMTGACRSFRPDPVPDDVPERLLDTSSRTMSNW